MHGPDRARFVAAVAFAVEAHGRQTRKGSDVPYVSHPIQVAGLVLEHGGDPQQATAALLHDVLEDCDVERATLAERFGAEVANIVDICTDLLPGDRPDRKSPWLARKRRHLARVRSADARTQLVVACDKLHNLRSLLADLRRDGPSTLDRFTAKPTQTRWYYEQIREALGDDTPRAILYELDTLLSELTRHVPRASEDP